MLLQPQTQYLLKLILSTGFPITLHNLALDYNPLYLIHSVLISFSLCSQGMLNYVTSKYCFHLQWTKYGNVIFQRMWSPTMWSRRGMYDSVNQIPAKVSLLRSKKCKITMLSPSARYIWLWRNKISVGIW